LSEGRFEAGRLFDKANSIILKPIVISPPGLHLRQYFILHDLLGREQAQETELSYPTETEPGRIRKAVEPRGGPAVMAVRLLG
jgi:hypothetical protein